MENSKTKLSKGLKRLLAATIVVAVAFLACFIVLAFFAKKTGDADLASFVGVMKYHLHGLLDLVLFRNASGSNHIIYFALSAFTYALFVCWVIFLVAGIIVNDKRNTSIMGHAIALSFISFLLYLVLASGARMYWHILNGSEIELKLLALVMVGLTAIYFLLSIIFYFWCIARSFLAYNASRNNREEYYEEEGDDEYIRRIVRDELIKNQPFKVVIVGNEAQKEEPKPEPAPVVVEEPVKEPEPVVEEVKEEPKPEPKPVPEKKAIYGSIDFWKVARTVWPQLDNPKPLPKEEQPAPAPIPEEEEEGWNRSKRQPFFMRIITAETETKVNYNELKNEILSYGVKARLSRGGETFRLKDKRYVKIYLVGKTLKVYLALSPEDYKDSTIPVEDVGHRPNYAEMPLLFKVRSGLSVRRCKELIKAAMEKDGLTQGEVKDTNWVDELRVLNAEKAKKQKA